MKIWRFLPLLAALFAAPAFGQSSIPPVNGTVVYATGGVWGTSSAPALTGLTLTGLAGGGLRCVTADNSGVFGAQACSGGLTIPNANILSGNGSVLGGITVGSGLSLTGSFPTQTLTATGGGGSGTVNSGTGPAIAQYLAGTGTTVGPATMSGDCTIAQGGAMSCLLVGTNLATWTRGGNATKLVTQGAGSTTSGHQLVYDASGNAIDGGAPGSGGTVTSVTCGTGLTCTPSSITATGSVADANTAVTPGAYTYSSVTVNAQGRLTAASSGTAPPVGANPTATVGTTPVNGTASTFMRSDAAPALAATGVTPGSYTNTNLTVNVAGQIVSASNGTGGAGGVSNWTGTFAGGPTAYTMAPTQSGFTNAAYNRVCGFFSTTNGAAPTLNVNSQGAITVLMNAEGGGQALVGGEIAANTTRCFILNTGAANWYLEGPANGTVINITGTSTNHNVTAAEWAAGVVIVMAGTTDTITFPSAATLAPNGAITVYGNPWSAFSNGTDTINGLVSNVNAYPFRGGNAVVFSTTGTGAPVNIQASDGHSDIFTISWIPGQNLASCASPPCAIPITSFTGASVIINATCYIGPTTEGSTATLDLYYTTGTTALTSGTKLTNTACNAAGTVNTLQSGLITTTPVVIPAGAILGLVTNNASWGSSPAGSGEFSISRR